MYKQIKKIGIERVHLTENGTTTLCHMIIGDNWFYPTKEGHYKLTDCETCLGMAGLSKDRPKARKEAKQLTLFGGDACK